MGRCQFSRFDLIGQPAVVAAISVLLLRGLTLASRFLLSVLLARTLPPDAVGEYGLITATLAFALVMLDLHRHVQRVARVTPDAYEAVLSQAPAVAQQRAPGTLQ